MLRVGLSSSDSLSISNVFLEPTWNLLGTNLRSTCGQLAFNLRPTCVQLAFKLRSNCVQIAFKLRPTDDCVRVNYVKFADVPTKIIEAWGSGIPKLMQAMKAYGLREPEFIDMDVAFRINLYRGQNEINGGKVPDIGGNKLLEYDFSFTHFS